MKKGLLIIGAVVVMLAGFAAQSFAGVSVHIGLFAPTPAYVVPAPVVYERERPVIVEETVYHQVPGEYHRYNRYGWHRDCDRWEHSRWDRNRYWDRQHDRQWDRAERDWR